MRKKMALVNFNKCHPEKCASGLCTAAQACNLKLLRQENPYEIPMPDPFSCRACGDCVRACPLKAVQLNGV
jgi:heterodisulfide reductase subunit A-like polyferredoxin